MCDDSLSDYILYNATLRRRINDRALRSRVPSTGMDHVHQNWISPQWSKVHFSDKIFG